MDIDNDVIEIELPSPTDFAEEKSASCRENCPNRIKRLDYSVSTYNEFFQNFLLENEPCIVENIGDNWNAFKFWVNGIGNVNLEHLNQEYGESKVNIAHCNEELFNEQPATELKFKEYAHLWKKGQAHNECLYLKDWHFIRDFPHSNIYRVPNLFSSDWLGEYYDRHPEFNDDYRFVYLGPKGTWTPLHADVFRSFSWSINVLGKKRWLLFKPGAEIYYKKSHGNYSFNKTLQVLSRTEDVYEFDQGVGEALFVPSGWFHQVWNLEDTLSINHNWINGTNIWAVWNALKERLNDVKEEIKHLKEMDDWDNHCQLMLKSLFGMNYTEFYLFLKETIRIRMSSIKDAKELIVFGNWKVGRNHIIFDVKQALSVLQNLLADSNWLIIQNAVTADALLFCKDVECFLTNSRDLKTL